MEFLQAKVLMDSYIESQSPDDAFYDQHGCEWLQTLMRWHGAVQAALGRRTKPHFNKVKTLDPELP